MTTHVSTGRVTLTLAELQRDIMKILPHRNLLSRF